MLEILIETKHTPIRSTGIYTFDGNKRCAMPTTLIQPNHALDILYERFIFSRIKINT